MFQPLPCFLGLRTWALWRRLSLCVIWDYTPWSRNCGTRNFRRGGGGINFSRNSFSPSPGDVVAECRHWLLRAALSPVRSRSHPQRLWWGEGWQGLLCHRVDRFSVWKFNMLLVGRLCLHVSTKSYFFQHWTFVIKLFDFFKCHAIKYSSPKFLVKIEMAKTHRGAGNKYQQAFKYEFEFYWVFYAVQKVIQISAINHEM